MLEHAPMSIHDEAYLTHGLILQPQEALANRPLGSGGGSMDDPPTVLSTPCSSPGKHCAW